LKKFLIATVLATLVTAGAGLGISQAQGGGQGQGNSDHGLCTAYFNGQKNGWDSHTPPPFQNLSDRAGDGSDSNSTTGDPADIWDFCDGLVDGQPSHGRYTCSKDSNNQTQCTENPGPGKS